MNNELSAGTTFSHYRIVSKIGAGGMGEVYLAQDTKLDRKVALKILPAEVAANQERMRRFVQEAKTASALNHPNIITIHEVDHTDSVHFIATEFIDGETLREQMRKAPLKLGEVLDVAGQIASALSAAHTAGILHRDIKPENIMLRRDGIVKVLDFGLAKLTERPPPESVDTEAPTSFKTDPGTVVGTAVYMSPEQARGMPVDVRTDIFSLGIVLYEMVAGRLPFEGSTCSEVLASILSEKEPQPLARYSREVPAELERIVSKALRKNRDQRYQTTQDLLLDLQSLKQELEFERKLERSAPPTSNTREPERTETVLASAARPTVSEGFWVAVLPFKYTGANADLTALAEGLSEEIVTGLSRFSYLRVIARGSTLKYSSESGDVRAIGKELGARYVMEASIRQAGLTVRLAVQLVDASTGAHLWAETFDRHFQPDQIFAMQDELIPRIVSTCADHFGVLARSISEAVRWKDSGQLSPYEALMRGFGYHHRLTPSEHAEAREVLERAVEQAPGNADCWAMLSWIYSHEYGHGFNTQPGSLDRALAAARRAVDLAPSNHLAYQTLAVALFFRKDTAGCLSAAERAMALNPLDASNEAIFLITFTGDWERGCALIARAMELNPYHPGWYRWVLAINEYRKANYREAVDAAVKANAPGIFWTNMLLAAARGQLGELDAARDALRNLLAQKQDFVESARETLGKWFDAELVGHLIEGLRKAGLEVDASLANSAGLRADEGFWVAVLPFKYRGSNVDLEALAEGLSEDIVTGLSRFSYLRVIARSSTLRYTSESGDMRAVGKELGARYVMEGNLRQAGTKLRLAVQLADATTGAHLWAENYERTFSPEAVFELQDDLVPRTVSTVADWYGVLPHSMSEAVRLKPPDQLSSYEAVLRSFGYYERITPEEHAAVRAGLERAVEQAPGNADGWAMLSMMYGEEHRFGFNAQPDPLGRSLQAARRAVDAAHANHFAWLALAQALFFRKEFDTFRDAAERAIALNPMDGSTVEYLAHLIAFSGDWERGCDVAERARQLNPNHPGWYWAVHFLDAYRKGDYRSARTFMLKANQPGHAYVFTQALLAALYGQLGDREAAEQTLRKLLSLKPDFALIGRNEFGKWYLPELVERLIDGLRKAGLEIVSENPVVSPVQASRPTDALSGFSSRPSIAVLPFANLSADKDQEYFSDGLTEEIINLLAHVSGLKVIARTSAFAFKGQNTDIRKIAEILGVTNVLQGSMQRAGNRIRVTAQLITAADGSHLWSERYDRQMEDLFAMQDEIAGAIASELKLKFAPAPAAHPRHQPDLNAYDAYLRYLHYQWGFTEESLRRSRECLEQAIALDPEFALPYAGLADHHLASTVANVRADEAMPRARELARKALELDPDLPEAHGMLGIVAGRYELDWKEAERRFRLAMAREPVPWHVRQWHAYFYLFSVGRLEEALQEAQRTIEDDPLSQVNYMCLGVIAEGLGLEKEARAAYAKTLELDPQFWWGWAQLGLHHAVYGRHADARACAEKAIAIFPSSPLNIGLLAGVLRSTGETQQAEAFLAKLEAGSYGAPIALTCFHLVCGEVDHAVEWAGRAVDERHPVVLLSSLIRPFERLFRKSPGWQVLLKKMNLSEIA